jgi:DHA3 family macrolide efflux protein-like MFS transporter
MAQAHRWLLTRDFSLMWWSQVLSQVAEGISKLALLWFVYAVTGSPLKTTVIGLLQTLPPILFGPFIGVIVDRFPKKTILIGSDIARGVLIGLIPCLVSVEHFTVGSLYLLTFLYGVATAVFVPTLSSPFPSWSLALNSRRRMRSSKVRPVSVSSSGRRSADLVLRSPVLRTCSA